MIRPWKAQDIPTLLTIEEQTQFAPWSLEVFEKCFQEYSGWVLEVDNKIIGFAVITLQLGECHILDICIDPAYQRQGHGRHLFMSVLHMAKNAGAVIAYLEVRASNQHAIHLYLQNGFSEVGRRKAYYPGPKGQEDALVLAMDLMNML